MNRSLTNVLFGGLGATVSTETREMEGAITKTTVEDTVEALTNADHVILVIPTFHPINQICLTESTGRGLWHGRGQGAVCDIRHLRYT